MLQIGPGYYTVNAFNLGEVLVSFESFEKRENVVYYPKIFRYKKKETSDVIFWINEFGSGVSFQLIPNATTLEEAKAVYNSHDYYYPTYNHLINVINQTFGTKIENTDISLTVEISRSRIKSEYAQLAIEYNEYFPFYLAVCIESLFILELCWLMERRLVFLLQQKRSYYSQRILTEFASSLFIIERPQGYLPNHQEFTFMQELYEAWGIVNLVDSLKGKFELALTNYKFSLEYDEKRQNMLMTLLLASITVFSINQTIPVIYDTFPELELMALIPRRWMILFFSFAAIAIAVYTFWKYYLDEAFDKIKFRLNQWWLKNKITGR